MDLKAVLTELKGLTMSAIAEAAKADDTRQVQALAKLAGEIGADVQEVSALEQRVDRYKDQLDNRSQTVGYAPVAGDWPLAPIAGNGSAKERGRKTREAFAARHRLQPVKGQIYRTPAGLSVGIPTATEQKPNRWFLGLPDRQPDLVVLLCHAGDELLEFVLPKTFVSDIWRHLSRSSSGDVKFNLVKRAGSYQLGVTGAGPLNISRFLGDYTPLSR